MCFKEKRVIASKMERKKKTEISATAESRIKRKGSSISDSKGFSYKPTSINNVMTPQWFKLNIAVKSEYILNPLWHLV